MVGRRRYRRMLQPSACCGLHGPRGAGPERASRPRRRGRPRAPPLSQRFHERDTAHSRGSFAGLIHEAGPAVGATGPAVHPYDAPKVSHGPRYNAASAAQGAGSLAAQGNRARGIPAALAGAGQVSRWKYS
jgi:hypothetical protein